MPAKYIWEWGNTTDGNYIGRKTTDKIGFYGAAPVVRPSSLSSAVATTAATSTTPHGFSSTQANAIVTLLNDIRTKLVALGLME